MINQFLVLGKSCFQSRSMPREFGARVSIGFLALAAALVLWAGDARAQTTAVCSDTPATGERILCEEGATSTDDIEITTSGVTISTTEDDEPGIRARHQGTGNIDITSQNDNITTTGTSNAQGIDATHNGTTTGEVSVRLIGTTIDSTGSWGVVASSYAVGGLDVHITGGSITSGQGVGIFNNYLGSDESPTTVTIDGNARLITLSGGRAGVELVRHTNIGMDNHILRGNSLISLNNVYIETNGLDSSGVRVKHAIPPGGDNTNIIGDIEIRLRGGVEILTKGTDGSGTYAHGAVEKVLVL